MRRPSLPAVLSVGLVVLTAAAYGPVWHNGFINLDDETAITQNPDVLGGLTPRDVRWAWTTFHTGNWIPLTWLSLQLDTDLSPTLSDGRHAPDPVLFHAQNLFWHAATVVLLFWTLRRMTGAVWCSAFAAALFAVHPLHVESVAWATERKDVLSTFFLVLTVLAYARYAERPSARRYLLVLACFVLGLLAKPMLVSLPFGLLLLDFWPLRRWGWGVPPSVESGGKKEKPARDRRGGKRGAQAVASLSGTSARRGLGWLLVEKLPLIALAAAASAVAVVAQRSSDAVWSAAELPADQRLANTAASYGWYLARTFWPAGLGLFYPHPHEHWRWGAVLAGGAVLLAVTVTSLAGARRWPWLTVGWLWFLGTLVPVIGIVQVGDQAHADRYAYVPHIGLFVALAWSAAALLDRLRVPTVLRATAAAACLVGLAALTWVQVGYWHDSGTVWEHTLAVTRDNHRAHYNLANYLFFERGRAGGDAAALALAREHYERALVLRPDFRYRYNLALLLRAEKDFDAARQQFLELVRLDPGSEDAWYNLAVEQLRSGRPEEASASLRQVLRINPRAADARALLRVAQSEQGRRGQTGGR
jgi:tetratricopeptide (TPR) repeat protein